MELFFDLVFVFAVSQLSSHLLTHLSWRGAAETLLMLLAIFAVWFTTSWSATIFRADQSRTRWLVSAVMLLGRQTFSKNNRKERKMKYTAMVISLSLLVSAVAVTGQALTTESSKKSQTISRAGSQPSVKGSAEYFTGNVRIDPLFPANESAPFSGAYVTFEPGARSAWHTHPTGQHLLVTAGVGRTQEWGGPIEEIKAGDVIWCPPKIKHWHGASPTTAMTHIAITGTVNGKNVEWMEKVTDEQYNGK
ncbi:MAG TPA: low temperature requirement protein A [Thermodesulfobacteriota bacterium]|nr:low temperature requirement protein A [Thermodesulfobacteriota bacterium]